MKVKKTVVALAAVLVPVLLFRVGSGFTEQPNVALYDHTVSEDGQTLTLYTGIGTSMGYIRDFKDEPHNGAHYLTFYNTFGGMNSALGAQSTFDLPVEDTDNAVYFNDSTGFHLVLQKDDRTGEWVKP